MFKIIGADGQQYGPVSADQIRQWIAQGRANAETLAQAEGSAEWKRLGDFPEFSSPPPPVQPPIPPSTPPMPVLPPTPMLPKTNGLAVMGLIMGAIGVTIGLICCGPLFSVLGIIFSSIALVQINRDPVRQTGEGMAIWGLVLSILGLILAIGIGLWALRGFGPGRHRYRFRYHWP